MRLNTPGTGSGRSGRGSPLPPSPANGPADAESRRLASIEAAALRTSNRMHQKRSDAGPAMILEPAEGRWASARVFTLSQVSHDGRMNES